MVCCKTGGQTEKEKISIENKCDLCSNDGLEEGDTNEVAQKALYTQKQILRSFQVCTEATMMPGSLEVFILPTLTKKMSTKAVATPRNCG